MNSSRFLAGAVASVVIAFAAPAAAQPPSDANAWIVLSGAPEYQNGNVLVLNTSDKEATVEMYGGGAPVKIAPGASWRGSFTSLPLYIFATERVYVSAAATVYSTPTAGGAGYSPVRYFDWFEIETVPVDCTAPDRFKHVCGLKPSWALSTVRTFQRPSVLKPND